jgi:hypothetical protein
MIDRININQFERILVKIKNQGQENESGKIAYPSEYRLKKLIHEYLRENQSAAFRIAEFAEPRQEGRTKKDDARKKTNTILANIYTLEAAENRVVFVWEVKMALPDHATYVFIAPKVRADEMYQRITHRIRADKNLRTYLTTNHADFNTDNPDRPRRYLGFAGSLRKTRGNISSFERWKEKLDSFVNSGELIDIIDDFDLKIPEKVIIRPPSPPRRKTIKTGKLPTEMKPREKTSPQPEPDKPFPPVKNPEIIDILEYLEGTFLKNFKPENYG